MIHKFGYKDLVHNDNQTNDCPVCKAEQDIIDIIKDRLIDFKSCNKDDSCNIYAKALEIVLDDIDYIKKEWQ